MINPPWSIQIELVEGCTKRCSFCGIQGIRKAPGNFKFMARETASESATQIKSYCSQVRIEFAMHGEPMMHPEFYSMIRLFRAHLPKTQFQLTTNGVKFLTKPFAEIAKSVFEAGIDFIILDTYRPERETLRDKALIAKRKGIRVLDFYTDCVAKGISPWHNHHRRLNHTVILMDDLGMEDGKTRNRVIYNHAGNNLSKLVPSSPLQKCCTIPFREPSICWNGDVNICCQDWKHENIVGNINKNSLQEIWEGKKFEAIRAMLYSKNRHLAPCYKCDINSGSYVGLLPKYAPPTKEQIKLAGGAR